MNKLQIDLEPDYSRIGEHALFIKCNLTIDDISPLERSDDDFDLLELFKSIHAEGNYFIFTCGCGVAACAGYNKGVKVTNENAITYWKDIDFGKEYSFSTAQIKEEVEKTYHEILKRREEASLKKLELKIYPEWSTPEQIIGAYNQEQ